jgi:FtsH-binding integral membrane protein
MKDEDMLDTYQEQNQHRLMQQIAVGKALGLLLGLIGFFILPYLLPEVSTLTRWGILCWYITFGAVIGMAAQIHYHPLLNCQLPWWLTSAIMGGWLNLVLTFFAYDVMLSMMLRLFGEHGLLQSPFWFAAEGLILGLFIGFGVNRFAPRVPLPKLHSSQE